MRLSGMVFVFIGCAALVGCWQRSIDQDDVVEFSDNALKELMDRDAEALCRRLSPDAVIVLKVSSEEGGETLTRSGAQVCEALRRAFVQPAGAGDTSSLHLTTGLPRISDDGRRAEFSLDLTGEMHFPDRTIAIDSHGIIRLELFSGEIRIAHGEGSQAHALL